MKKVLAVLILFVSAGFASADDFFNMPPPPKAPTFCNAEPASEQPASVSSVPYWTPPFHPQVQFAAPMPVYYYPMQPVYYSAPSCPGGVCGRR